MGADLAGPHAVTSATVNGVLHTPDYDLNGAMIEIDIAGTTDGKYLAYNAFNQPTTIVVGSGLSDPSPVAKDEFAYGPNGERIARKSTWQDGASTYTEEVAYVGAVEIITDDSSGTTQTITKTSISPNVMHVKIEGATTETFFEYAHRDHLGSIEVVTDDNGNVLDRLAFEPFGSRKQKDWTANISTTELDALLDSGSGYTRKARGFTGHEHLDRTGFVHMNGRVYDPVLGRFVSPDPIVQFPGFSQSWNRYSYLNGTPTSFVDPSGFLGESRITRIDGGGWNDGRRELPPGDTYRRRDYGHQREWASRERGHPSVQSQFENETSQANTPSYGSLMFAQFSISPGSAVNLGNLIDELTGELYQEIRRLDEAAKENEGYLNNGPLIVGLSNIGYLKGDILDHRYLREKNPINNLRLSAMYLDARAPLVDDWIDIHLPEIAQQLENVYVNYATFGGRTNPKSLLKKQVKNIIYHATDTPTAIRQIIDAAYSIASAGMKL